MINTLVFLIPVFNASSAAKDFVSIEAPSAIDARVSFELLASSVDSVRPWFVDSSRDWSIGDHPLEVDEPLATCDWLDELAGC